MQVPDGYVAQTWFFDLVGVGGEDAAHASNLRVSVGGYGVTCSVAGIGEILLFFSNWATQTVLPVNTDTNTLSLPVLGDVLPTQTFPVGDITTGSIPVSVNNNGFLAEDTTLNVVIQCGQLPVGKDPNNNGKPYGKPYSDWQMDTFNLIAGAYQSP